MGKQINWQYVNRAQCRTINFTKTDKDLMNTFGMSLGQKYYTVMRF